MTGRLTRIAILSGLAGWVASCAPMQVNSFATPAADMRAYKTYAWDTAELGVTGDPRLDNNRIFMDRVQQAADAQMRFRGYERLTRGTADMTLHIHARVEQQIDSALLDVDRACQQPECRSYVYDRGTLLLDVVETRSKALIWRGWAERSLDGVVDNQDAMNQVIDRAVSAIFARMPVRHLEGGRASGLTSESRFR
jgi:hypothetical protein